MRKRICLLTAFAAMVVLLPSVYARAGDDEKTADPSAVNGQQANPSQGVTTQGTVEVGGQQIQYNAVAGTITVAATDAQDAQLGTDGKPLRDTDLAAEFAAAKNTEDQPPLAHMFYVAYFRRDANLDRRPITFLYNGGPGSSSMWLQMGAFGPKRVDTDDIDTHLAAAPYKLEDNPNCLLDVSDLVFIDAPGTGFSLMTGKNKDKAFWGVQEDANAFARFIQRFLSIYSRWNSPKYLFGESYGTTRSAVLSNVLENNDNIDLNGVMLLSQIFNFTIDIDMAHQNPGVDLTYELALPTYAATALYHHKLPQPEPSLQPFLKQVEDFAMGAYAHALDQGTDLSQTEKQAVAEKLHQYTGLPVDYLMLGDLRISGPQFEKALLGASDMTTGRLDTRFSGPSIDPLSEIAQYDPQASAIASAYVSLFNQYVRQTLKYGQDQTYIPLSNTANEQWNFKNKANPWEVNVSQDLAAAMKTDPKLRVMVNGGYYDLATPFFGAMYDDKHLPIPQSLAGNIQYDWYESGHMVYVHTASLNKLHDNVAAFIRSTEAGNE